MLPTDLNRVSSSELIDELREIESSPIEVKERDGGIALRFRGTDKELPHVSNIELLCRWANTHSYSVSLIADGDSITINLFQLYPANPKQ